MRLRVELPEGTTEWESDVALFRVGRADTCALRFEGAAAKYSSWEHAEFRRDDEGNTYVSDLESSNGTYVDGNRIGEPTPLWVGAVVQIGTKGPKLQVLELPRPAQPAVATASSAKGPAASRQQQALVIGLAVALLLVVGFLLFRGGSSPPAPNVAEAANGKESTEKDKDSGPNVGIEPKETTQHALTSAPVNPPRQQQQHQQQTDDEPPVTAAPPKPAVTDPWIAAKDAALPSYRLIAIEDPKTETTWPFAGAAVVAPQAMLTTADVGVELAKFQARGMNVKAVRDSQDAGVPVDRLRVHAAFQTASPEEQLFFDVAILHTSEPLTGAATRAPAAELATIERGQPLACIATDHTGEPINRFEPLSPEWRMSKVFAVTRLSSEAGAPRVLQVRGALSDKLSGSPIFNDQGHLVALYCEPAPGDGGPPDRALHYAKLIEPQFVELGLSASENPNWVAPVVPPQPPAKEKPAK